MLHTFTTSMALPLPRDRVFAFFAEATNRQRITPPELGFEIVTPPPIHLGEGTCIEYRLHLFGIPFTWQSQIQHWHPPEAFVDIQLRGPYKQWIHTHRFREAPGATLMEDEVQYALPYGGSIAAPRRLGTIYPWETCSPCFRCLLLGGVLPYGHAARQTALVEMPHNERAASRFDSLGPGHTTPVQESGHRRSMDKL